MNLTEAYLLKISEECAEVAQRCSKAIRFGLSEKQSGQDLDNEERLRLEITDLCAAIQMLEKHIQKGLVVPSRIPEVQAKINRFMAYSKELGILHD